MYSNNSIFCTDACALSMQFRSPDFCDEDVPQLHEIILNNHWDMFPTRTSGSACQTCPLIDISSSGMGHLAGILHHKLNQFHFDDTPLENLL